MSDSKAGGKRRSNLSSSPSHPDTHPIQDPPPDAPAGAPDSPPRRRRKETRRDPGSDSRPEEPSVPDPHSLKAVPQEPEIRDSHTPQPARHEPSAADPYAPQLAPQGLAAYHAATADIDLSREIRLMRAVLAILSADIEENHAPMARTLQSLLRAVYLQAQHATDSGELDAMLQWASEQVLKETHQ